MSSEKLKKVVGDVVRGKDPTYFTFSQIKELVEKQLAKEGGGGYNFANKELKKALKELVVKAFERELARAKVAAEEEEEEEADSPPPKKKSKRSTEDSSDGDHQARQKKETNKKKGGASSSSVGSASSSASAQQEAEDTDFKALKDLALAMNLVPAIYKGFGEMDVEEKKDALRARLKEKGAVFKHVPTKEQIREARAAKELAKDLEGIDTSNIIESGARRRRVAAVVVKGGSKGDGGKKKRKRTEGEEEGGETESTSSSSSEDDDDDDDDDDDGDDDDDEEEEADLD